MKRIVAILMCLALACSCTAALAETITLPENSDLFDMTLDVAEGVEIAGPTLDGDYIDLLANKGTLANVFVSIAPSEVYAGQSLADLSAEDKALLQEQTAEDCSDPVTELSTTPSGNEYILVRDKGEYASATIFTIYKGYFVQLTQFHDDFSALTDEDTEFMMSLLYGIEFVDVAQ